MHYRVALVVVAEEEQMMAVMVVLAEVLALIIAVVVVIHLCVHLMETVLLVKVIMVEKLTTAAEDLVLTNLAAAVAALEL